MGYGGQLISLNDLNVNSYIGIGFPYNKPGVFTQTYNTIESTTANLINFFLTNKGDRYMNPSFGAGFRDLIFELITPELITLVEETIINGIENHFPGVEINQLDIEPQEDLNRIIVRMRFSLQRTGDTNVIDLSIANNNISVKEYLSDFNNTIPGSAVPGIRQSFS